MATQNKDQEAILQKLGITNLNEMQISAQEAISIYKEIVLLSPTGSGKTLAFLLPIIAALDPTEDQVQALIVVPSRELAIQIEQVVREMGSGYKANAVYGGRSGYQDRMELKHAPAILIGTPGRIGDHIKNETIGAESIRFLVLDEFDKSLEVGFEEDMRYIVESLPSLEKKILTSATQKVKIPDFVGLKNVKYLNHLTESIPKIKIKTVISPTEDKLETLEKLMGHVGQSSGILFCNFKETINMVSEFLTSKEIGHVCFFGGLEQVDRERALIKFRNGTHRLLVATDLAARGIDVPELDFIIHFELPPKKDEFIHRNGRTARMQSDGIAYIIKWDKQSLPDFIEKAETIALKNNQQAAKSKWKTLHISGGRKDKISKGDIAGLFFKQGNLRSDEVGDIVLNQDHSFVAVPASKANVLIQLLNNAKLKKRKVRITVLE